MLRRSLIQFRHAYDPIRRVIVDAIDATRRSGGLFFTDAGRQERLVLVRSIGRMPHFRRYPRRMTGGTERPSGPSIRTPHQRAVRRVYLELLTGEGLTCQYHAGTVVRSSALVLISGKQPPHLLVERTILVAGRRIAPDLLVVCPVTERRLLAIEICASHPVGLAKLAAYAAEGLPWIEVRALHTMRRFRRAPLCAENWGGGSFPQPPLQQSLMLATFREEAGPASKPGHNQLTSAVHLSSGHLLEESLLE
jgi:hypothetical protein